MATDPKTHAGETWQSRTDNPSICSNCGLRMFQHQIAGVVIRCVPAWPIEAGVQALRALDPNVYPPEVSSRIRAMSRARELGSADRADGDKSDCFALTELELLEVFDMLAFREPLKTSEIAYQTQVLTEHGLLEEFGPLIGGALLSYLAEAVAASREQGWQSMETAPVSRDGRQSISDPDLPSPPKETT